MGTKHFLLPVDHDALRRAVEVARKDPELWDLLERKRRAGEDFVELGKTAAYSQQIDNLKLKPWQDPPMYGELGDADALALLKKLLEAGLSRFEPDPLAALAEAAAHGRGAKGRSHAKGKKARRRIGRDD